MATSGLEKLGVAGGEDLRETLTNCTDPLKAIEQFQLENGVLLPSLQSALPFLDLHAIPRLDFHQSVFDELRDKLLERVAVIATEGPPLSRNTKLEELLEKSFALVRMPSVQPVVMCLLKHIPKVPERYLKQVTSDPALYAACATEVKRQIWQENQALFGDEASPLFKQYLAERETALLGPELSAVHTFYSSSPKARRHGQVVQKLTGMIGRNVKLYDMVLQFLRTLFLRTRNPHYCTLRAELLMALHDLEATDICSVDPCHKFTWCLDACIRERFVDVKRARELQGFLDGIKRGQEQVLGDLSMILCDPFAINTLAMSTMKTLQELVSHESLPRDSPDLQLLLRMLALGLGAWDMIDSQAFREPKLDVEVATRFLPALMTLLVDDLTFGVDARLPAEGGTPPTYPSGLPPAFTKWVQEHPVACEMGLYYVLHVTRQRNKNAIARVLPALAEFHRDAGYSDWFLHLFLSQLTLLADELGSEGLCGALFDSFLLPALSRENVHRHTLRLVLHVHAKLLPARLTTLRTALQPNKQSGDVVKELHTAFLAKGDSRLPGTAATAATAPVSATGVALTPGLTPVLALTQPVTISTATTAATAAATSVGTATGTATGTVPGTSAGTIPGTTAGTVPGTAAGTVAGGGASAGGAGGGESPRVSVAATVTPPP